MPTVHGTYQATEEELQQYRSSSIMLMDNSNDTVGSGGSEMSGSINWTLRWDSQGFTGIRWTDAWGSGTYDYASLYAAGNGSLEAVFEDFGYYIANSLTERGLEEYVIGRCVEVS